MRIAVFSDFFYPELSGVTDSITLLGKTLALRGHSVVFAVPHYSKHDYKKVDLPKGEQSHNPNISIKRLPAIKYPYSPTGQSRIALPLGRGVMLAKKFNPDVIHTHSLFGPGLEALWASRTLNKPLMGTNHTPLSEFLTYSPIKSKFFIKSLLRYCSWYYNRCAYVSAPSNSLLEEMEIYGLNRPHRAISNPLDLKRFSPVSGKTEKESLKNTFSFSNHTVLYTGRLAKEKHVDVVIKAVSFVKSRIPDVSLVLTGRGAAEHRLRILTAELKLERNVKFLGFVDDETYPLIYKASDLFVIMSTAESQSLSLMQAMASGLPVIGAKARALPEYINENNGFLIEPGDYSLLAEKIITLLKDNELSQKLARGGVNFAQNFKVEIIAQQWEELYAEVSKNRKI